MKILFVSVSILLILGTSARLRVIPEEHFESCEGGDSSGFHRSGDLIDFYNEYILDDNDKVIINSNLTFKVPITLKEKLFVRIVGHQFYMGTWQKRFVNTMSDTCNDVFNPLDIHYPYFKDFKRCPWDTDVSKFI